MTEGQKPDDKAEIEGILADLEAILSEKAPDKGRPKTEPGIANIIAGLGDALKQAQSQGAAPPPPSAPPPPQAGTPGQPASKPPSTVSPFEIKLDMPARGPIPTVPTPPSAKLPSAGPPPAASHPPAPANPPPAQPKPAAPVPQQPSGAQVPPSPGSVPTPAAFPSASFTEIPEEAPKDQIRRVAFLYSSGQKMPLIEFIRFVDSLALHFSKKPLYLRKVYLAELSPDNDLNAVAEKIKAAGAVGVVGVLPGIHENRVRTLETGLTAASISYYWLTPEEAFKRPVVLGLVVELMLLNAD